MEVKNVSPGKPRVNGAIFRAPLGTPLPTDAATQLNEAFKDLGLVSQDGVTNSNTATKQKVYAWGGTPVMNSTTEKPDDFTITLIEALNPEVLKTVYGDDNVVVADDGKKISIKATAADASAASYVIDMMLKDGALKRIVIPQAELSTVAEIVYQDAQPVGYKLTLSALADSDGVSHHEYIQKAGAAQANAEPANNGEGDA